MFPSRSPGYIYVIQPSKEPEGEGEGEEVVEDDDNDEGAAGVTGDWWWWRQVAAVTGCSCDRDTAGDSGTLGHRSSQDTLQPLSLLQVPGMRA